ncbi:hypothetical protein pb186bvf_013338 [Paramecium bursaria]
MLKKPYSASSKHEIPNKCILEKKIMNRKTSLILRDQKDFKDGTSTNKVYMSAKQLTLLKKPKEVKPQSMRSIKNVQMDGNQVIKSENYLKIQPQIVFEDDKVHVITSMRQRPQKVLSQTEATSPLKTDNMLEISGNRVFIKNSSPAFKLQGFSNKMSQGILSNHFLSLINLSSRIKA